MLILFSSITAHESLPSAPFGLGETNTILRRLVYLPRHSDELPIVSRILSCPDDIQLGAMIVDSHDQETLE